MRNGGDLARKWRGFGKEMAGIWQGNGGDLARSVGVSESIFFDSIAAS